MNNVLDLIKARSSQFTQNGSFSDNFKLGLSVEGGGMRGVVTASMLMALQEIGLLDVFDSYYGASSGCTNLAYVLAGQGWQGLDIYYDKLATRAFISPRRALYGKEVMDIGYVRSLFETEMPLDFEALQETKKDFVITLSNVTRKEGELRRYYSNRQEFWDVLTASIQIPVLGGRPVAVDNEQYLDGGLFYVDPYYAAIEDGCTHVLALHSRPQNGYPSHPTSGSSLAAQLIDSMAPGIGDIYVQRLAAYYQESATVGFGNITKDKVHLYRHAVGPDGHNVKRMTTNYEKLIRAGQAGYDSIYTLFRPGGQSLVRYENFRQR